MVRWLVSILLVMSVAHARAEDLYLSSSQKAALSLGLQAVLLKRDDAKYLVKSIINRAKTLEAQQRRTVEVGSYEEFIKFQKNDALYGQHKLAQIQVDQLFEVMPDPVYYSRSSRVQSKINKYETEKANFKQGLAVSALGLSYSFASDADEEVKLNDFQNFLKEKINNYTETFINKMTQGTDSKYVSILAKLLKSYFEAFADLAESRNYLSLNAAATSAKIIRCFLNDDSKHRSANAKVGTNYWT